MEESSNNMVVKNEKIKVYLRIRPTQTNTNHLNINEENNLLELIIPKNVNSGYVNNTKVKYSFQFDGLLNMHTKQEKVFSEIATDVINSSLDGYNGTIFAYGQTGSGKTYTITGGAERMEDRGIIPRTISYLFNEIKKRTLYKWKIYISYLEIYNNDGYDLLHENQGKAKNLEELPKVKIRENANKQFLLYNLSVHHVENEEEGMMLLLLGDENRVVAETPKNDASTRSHCIFMFQIESQKIGEENTKTLSKLHIVDLSGSEKPYKTDLNGIRMEEALNINLSLHFLEQVIVSLNKNSSHIPHRNSMMTMCLRDSLGGNCKTRMIATLSADYVDVMESISTCRFAQRVALVQNKAVKNEIEDPVVLIQKQKFEIEELKSELALLKGVEQKSFLNNEEQINCKRIVEDYLKDDNYNKRINLKDMLMINECFSIIKIYYKDLEKKLSLHKKEVVLDNVTNLDHVIEIENCNKKLNCEIEKLRELITRKDEEIKILLGIIDKMKNERTNNNKSLLSRLEEEDSRLNLIRNNNLGDEISFNLSSKNEKTPIDNIVKINVSNIDRVSTSTISNSKTVKDLQSIKNTPFPMQLLQEINTAYSYVIKSIDVNSDILSNRLVSYDLFKKNYIKSESILENLKLIEEKYKIGTKIGENFTKLKDKSQVLKNQIVEIRKQKIIDNIDDEKNPNNPIKIKEDLLLNEYSKIKSLEKQEQNTLKTLHDEIKSIKTLIETNEKKRAKDFEYWYEVMIKKLEWENKYGPSDYFNIKNNNTENKLINNYTFTSSKNLTVNQSTDNITENSISNIAERINTKNKIIMSQIK